jgi:hypothetical protein
MCPVVKTFNSPSLPCKRKNEKRIEHFLVPSFRHRRRGDQKKKNQKPPTFSSSQGLPSGTLRSNAVQPVKSNA